MAPDERWTFPDVGPEDVVDDLGPSIIQDKSNSRLRKGPVTYVTSHGKLLEPKGRLWCGAEPETGCGSFRDGWTGFAGSHEGL
jgi:hypothetical protein